MLGNPWDYATWSLVVTLGLLMFAACEIGYRHGYRWGREQSEHARTVSNMVIDLNTTRYWAANSHMPAAVLVMLAVCAVVACILIGHSCGQTDRRHAGLWLALITLFGLTLYVILDFDRPTLGIVRVDHTPLEQLQKSFEANPLSPPLE